MQKFGIIIVFYNLIFADENSAGNMRQWKSGFSLVASEIFASDMRRVVKRTEQEEKLSSLCSHLKFKYFNFCQTNQTSYLSQAYHNLWSNRYWVNDPHIRQFHSGDANIWSSIFFPNFHWWKAKCVSGNLALGNSDFYSDDVSNSFKPNK